MLSRRRSSKGFKVNVNGVLWGVQAAAKKFMDLSRQERGRES